MTGQRGVGGPTDFGATLRRYREAAGLSQAQLAERARLSLNAVSALERGARRNPYPSTLDALSRALGLSIEERAGLIALARGRQDHPALQEMAPPFQSTPNLRALPRAPTPLVGRREEARELLARLTTSRPERLVTLTGPGGVGKTRLAMEVAAHAVPFFSGGARWVELTHVRSRALLLPVIATALEIHEGGEKSAATLLVDHLREKHLLLVLDNFEQVVEAAPEVSALLAACPRLVILATSRIPLRVQGEREFPLDPLSVPEAAPRLPIREVERAPAVELFVRRAQAVDPRFALTSANVESVAAITRQLDGLPLALELAAARVKMLPPEALRSRLSASLQVLSGGARDLPERQRTMRGAIAWSYELLRPEEQRLFQQLGVFAGGWTLESASAICGPPDGSDSLLEPLFVLLENSLVFRMEGAGEDRYGTLETIRAFALEQLDASADGHRTRDRHLHWFRALAQEAEGQLYGEQQLLWLERLEHEHPNLRAAMEWAFASPSTSERVEQGLALAGAIYRYWQGRGYLTEGRKWLELGLAHGASCSPAVRAYALNQLGWLTSQQDEAERATELLEESVRIYRKLGDARGMAEALDSLGDVAWAQSRWEQAATAYRESLELRRVVGRPHEVGLSLYSLGRVYLDSGHHRQAGPLLEEALALLQKVSDQRGIALARHALGRLALHAGAPQQATEQIRQALTQFHSLGNQVDIAECLEALALVAQAMGGIERAATLWAAADTLRASIGVPRRAVDETALAAARDSVPVARWEAAWDEGAALTLDEAVERALQT